VNLRFDDLILNYQEEKQGLPSRTEIQQTTNYVWEELGKHGSTNLD